MESNVSTYRMNNELVIILSAHGHYHDNRDSLLDVHYFFFFQLGPWLAVEIPDLISRGIVKHKDDQVTE